MPLFFNKYVVVFFAPLLVGIAEAKEQADPTAPPKGDYVLQIARPAAHYREVQESLKSRDEGTRTEALENAMKDPDPAIRALALSSYLTRFGELTPEVVLETGGSLSPEDVPQMGISSIKWSDDGKSLNAINAVRCAGAQGVTGQIAGGKLTVRYQALCLPATYISKDDSARKAAKLSAASCSVTFAPNEQDNELDGLLRCLGISTMAKVKLEFGE